MPGSLYKPIHRGRLYAIDRQGKLQWPAPVDDQESVPAGESAVGRADRDLRLPNLPAESRTASRVTGRRCCASTNGTAERRSKRRSTTTTGLFEVTGDAAKKTVDLTMQQNTVTLTFTDKPLPPARRPPKPDKASPANKTIRALWDSVQKILGQDDDDSGREGD